MIKRLLKSAFTQYAIVPWMMVVAIIPIILVSLVAYDFAAKSLESAIRSNINTTIDKKVETIGDYINERKLYLMQISELPNLAETLTKTQASPNIALANEMMLPLQNYLNHFSRILDISNLFLVNLNDKIIYSLYPDAILGATLSLSSSENLEIEKAYRGAKIMLMPFIFSAFSNTNNVKETHLYLSNPVFDNKSILRGVLIMKLNPSEIAKTLRRFVEYSSSEETILATLQHHQPLLVMHTRKQPDKIVENSNIPQLNTLLIRAIYGESSDPIELKINNTNLIAITRYVPQLNMGMLTLYNKAEAYQKVMWLRTNMLVSISIGLLIVALIAYWISSKLSEANLKSERLLHNIFPDFVIEELKERKQFTARNIANVSVIFIDIVNFTAFAANKPPETVVNFLDEIFSLFDKLIHKYGLEKIKTIGDAYMAAAGLTETQIDHADRAVRVGLEMIKAMKHYNLDHHSNFDLRVGIDSGIITTGIIGETKFSYDLWGNVVNTANRMETTGIENTVQITQNTYKALQYKESYRMSLRKNVTVKGLGTMDTFLIEGFKR